jgi:simple sugar transport system ATP-binding protein
MRKRFGAVTALDGAHLRVTSGTVHALLGTNGAGKTTLMRVACGLERADEGSIRVHGTPHQFATPAGAIAGGLWMVQQHFTLVPAMTVLENVVIGLSYQQRLDADSLRDLSVRAGLPIDPDAAVSSLGIGAQQRVELMKALTREARVLILDEPTASLAPAEVEALFRWLRRFAQGGGTAVLITHKLREAFAIADELTVLRNGATVLTTSTTEVEHAAVIGAMLGQGVDRDVRANDAGRTPGHAVAATIEDVDIDDGHGSRRLREATLAVHAGEILGVAGVEGSGYRELLRVLAGRLAPTNGRASVPAEVAFVPEDRHREALAPEESIVNNVALRGAGARRGMMVPSTLAAAATRLVQEYGIVATDVRAPVTSLSGGNQQRLVVARELDGDPPLIVVENPTRGLDVAAATLVRRLLRDATTRGVAVVYFSADLDEVLELADRVVVTHGGSVRAVVKDRNAIGRAMLGAA